MVGVLENEMGSGGGKMEEEKDHRRRSSLPLEEMAVEYHDFMEWVEGDMKIKVNGIVPLRIDGAGLGIIAMKTIEPGETILTIPLPALRTISTIPPIIRNACPPETSVHALLALDIALDPTSAYTTWRSVFPSLSSFKACMPLLWSPARQARLPGPARKLVEGQKNKIYRDWGLVSPVLGVSQKHKRRTSSVSSVGSIKSVSSSGDGGSGSGGAGGSAVEGKKRITYTEFLHAWLLVNTRTFYHHAPPFSSSRTSTSKSCTTPKTTTKSTSPYTSTNSSSGRSANTNHIPEEDRLCLQPFADLFNHVPSSGCHATAPTPANPYFVVKADRRYHRGDEVCISYGRHGNDFLLAEYGFLITPRSTNGGDAGRSGDGGGEKAEKKGGGGGGGSGNEWDEALLDDAVLPALLRGPGTARRRELLKEHNFMGGYMVDSSTAGLCFRGEVAVRMMVVGESEWLNFVLSGGIVDREGGGGGGGGGAWGERERKKDVDRLMVELLEGYLSNNVGAMIRDCQRDGDEVLAVRWRQIGEMVRGSVKRLREGGEGGL